MQNNDPLSCEPVVTSRGNYDWLAKLQLILLTTESSFRGFVGLTSFESPLTGYTCSPAKLSKYSLMSYPVYDFIDNVDYT